MSGLLRRFMGDQSGATAIEYALLAGLIALAVVASARQLGSSLDNSFKNTANALGS